MKCQNDACSNEFVREYNSITVTITSVLNWDVTIRICDECYEIWDEQ